MWNLGNRDIVVLVSVISGCAILCNVWGTFYALTIVLVLAICAWFTLVVADDTPITPRALLALDYLEEAGREIRAFGEQFYGHSRGYAADVLGAVKRLYLVHVVERMAQRRRSAYQLSAETFPSSGSPRFSLVGGLSPISRAGAFRSAGNSSNVENSPYAEAGSRILERSASTSKVTSTPLVPWRREETRNGDVFGADHATTQRSPWVKIGASPQNLSMTRAEDTTYSNEGSPWGTSISPKMRARASGVKTVQTVAGPLLASTRYNIDPKVYSDITSPGLTSRLTKYATEANTKLTHQSQYGTGQFPRVNLSSSPTPLINTRTGKMRTPVTVRVAPPENTRYSPPERQKILSDICHAEVKTAPSVVQVLKEISLKRHASREDVTFELAKKQRTEGVFSDGLENLEEMTQKRARDDSSRSEEEISPQNKSLRPAKRTKMPSCHDILSSLSSSINVSSGVKRKAIDISRSGTPDVGKHFKSLDSSHGDGPTAAAQSRTLVEPARSNKRAISDLDSSRIASDVCSPQKKLPESVAQKGILKSPPGKQMLQNVSGDARVAAENWSRGVEEREARIARENALAQPHPAVKLTDRLFMKAEPQNIDKLKTLIEEHGSIKPRFVTNDSDEIKKSDIVNMRQTSMKNRLKSMFDAISGKAPSAINPEVVIQAEEAKSTASSAITASLSSTTSTTNVNTSPIATSAIVPIIGKTKPSTTPAKHVTFQFASAESSTKTDGADSCKMIPNVGTTKPTSVAETTKEPAKIASPAVTDKPATNSIFQSFSSPSAAPATSVAAPAFSFGSSASKTNSPATTKSTTVPAATSTPASSIPSTVAAITTSPPQFNSTQMFNTSTTSAAVFANSTPTVAKTTAVSMANFTNATTVAEKTSQPNFSFGNPATSVAAPPATAQSAVFASTTTQDFAALTSPGFTKVTATGFGITSNKTTTAAPAAFGASTTNNFASTPATTSMFAFGGNSAPQTAEKKAFSFGGPTAATTAQSASGLGSVATSQPPATSTPAASAASTGFSFSSNAAPAKSNGSGLFGVPATTSSAPASVFPPATSTTAAFSFGANATATAKPAFSFGASTTAAPTAAATPAQTSVAFGATNAATPLFGAPATTATGTTTSQPNLFGAPATSSGFASATSAPTFGMTGGQPAFTTPNTTSGGTFGATKTMDTPSFGGNSAGAPPSFAASTAASSLFGGAAGASSTTNANSTSATPGFGTGAFGETKPPPAFGANASSNFSAGTGSLFGVRTGCTPSAATSEGSSLFGTPGSHSASTFGTPATAPPAFGTHNSSATTTTFGAPNTTATTTTFGAPNTSATTTFGAPNTSATTTFGAPNTSATTTFGAPNTSATTTFGAPNTSATTTFGAPNTSATTTFGVPNTAATTTTFGAPNTSTPAFGASGTATSAFGLQSSAAATSGNQNPTSSAFSSTSSAFGATTTAPPAFGTTITSPPSGFGNSASGGFGAPSNNPPPAFSSANSSFSGFGGGSSNVASPFGGQPAASAAAATSTFGTPNAAAPSFGGNAGNGGSFSFGAAQPAAQQPQQSAVFAFGGGNSAATTGNATGAAAPFQFGNSAPQTGGFNFSGAPTTPALNFSRDGASGGSFPAQPLGANAVGAFNAPPAGGMFSIGSGSTGPRTRPSRRRQR